MSNPVSVNNLWVPVSCVGAIVAVGMSFGVTYQKVEGLREQMSDLKSQVATMDAKLDRVLFEKTNVSLK